MSRGFMVDTTQNHNLMQFRPSYWIQGEPENAKSIFGTPIEESFDISSRVKYMLRALRCDKCGYVEHYAVRIYF